MSSIPEIFPDPTIRNMPAASRILPVVAIAVVLCLSPLADFVPFAWTPSLFFVGVSVFAVVLIGMARGYLSDRSSQKTALLLENFADLDVQPNLIVNAAGVVCVANAAAQRRFGAKPGLRIETCLRSVFANPSAILLRLQSRVLETGRVQDDIVSKGHVTTVTLSRLGENLFVWQFEIGARSPWEDAVFPVLSVGRNGLVLGSNPEARAVFGFDPDTIDQLFDQGLPAPGHIVKTETPNGIISLSVCQLSEKGQRRDVALIPVTAEAEDKDYTRFKDLPVPVMRLDTDGRILDVNRLAFELIGQVSPGTTHLEEVMQGLSYPIDDWLKRTACEEEAPRSEFLRLTRKDKEMFVQVTLNRVIENSQTSLIAVMNDATELKTLEAQFVQGQKMQAVGQLAGGVAHDFNNLLTAISGHCDLLLLRHDQSDPNYGDLVQINQNANRAAALVNQLLAFSRKQTLRPEVLNLRDTISDLIHLLNRLVGEKIRLTLSHDPVLKPVRADKRQLEQVLMNLVVNARDAMPEGGEIRIETQVVTLSEPLRRDRATVEPGEYVTVKVIDEGIGIPSDKLQKVFEPFYTTKRTGEGTGLGLSTVYGIVKQTGGFIFVDSIQGRGTEFMVFLPVCSASTTTETQVPDLPDVQNARQGEGVVLLVEDEAPVRAFATRALRLKGYTVLEADSAETALRLLEDPDLTVDVFATDVVMPGMDGPTWVRKALETRPDVQVIFMSGYTEGAFGESGPEIANSTFLPKPFSLNQLTEAVFQQLN